MREDLVKRIKEFVKDKRGIAREKKREIKRKKRVNVE
jgi:hypothetical protein